MVHHSPEMISYQFSCRGWAVLTDSPMCTDYLIFTREQYYAIRPVFVSKAQRACSMVASKGFGRGRPTVECERTSYSQAEGAGGGDNTGILIQPVIDGCLCVC